eukprot:3919735-Pyramimonas_sp.AAC.1
MGLKDMQRLFPIAMRLQLNAAARQRHTEAIMIKTNLVPPGAKSIAAINDWARTWMEGAEEIRNDASGQQIDAELATMSAAAFA